MQIPCIIKRRYFKKEVYVVYKIVKKQTLNQAVELMEIHAPYVARKCEPGQFIIIRVDEDGERVPLTIADYDREKETVTIIYQVVGYTTELLSKKAEGDYVHSNTSDDNVWAFSYPEVESTRDPLLNTAPVAYDFNK